MKLKEILDTKEMCEAKVNAFRNFYELKCHLPGLITQKNIIVRKDLYPKGIYKVIANQDNKNMIFIIHMKTKFGDYKVHSLMELETGKIIVFFAREYYEEKNKNGETNIDFYVPKKQFDKFVLKYRPIVESFFDNLIKLKKNQMCSNNCYYEKSKMGNGKCKRMYISKKGFTEKENKRRQRMLTNIEDFLKNKKV